MAFSPKPKPNDVPLGGNDLPAADAALKDLGRQLAAAVTVGRKRLLRRMVLVASILTGAAMGLQAIPGVSVVENALGDYGGPALLAMVVATATTASLLPVIRQQERSLIDALAVLSTSNLDLLSLLGKLTELRDRETAGHTLRVAVCTVLFAKKLGFDPEMVVRATKGALVHDLGKLAVPDSVLGKPGPLDGAERRIMAAHVELGAEAVLRSHYLRDAVAVVAAHHEHYDGGGYPKGLKGDKIPLEARMFGLIDVFDALTSRRVYKPALGAKDALAIMAEGRGTHFDPALFDPFAQFALTLAEQIPASEQEMMALLASNLRPYLDRFLLGTDMAPFTAETMGAR